MKKAMLGILIGAVCASASYAGVIKDANKAAAQQSWSAWGGSIGMVWNRGLLENLGVTVGDASERTNEQDRRGHTWFAVRQTDGLRFNVVNGALQGFSGGSIQMRGGFSLILRDGSTVDLRNLTLRPRSNNSRVLDLVSADGKAWLYSDRLMFELTDNNRTLAVRAADIRVSDALAARIGSPESSGWEIADFAMNAQVNIEGSDLRPDRVCTPYPWPNVQVPGGGGAVYQADLFMQTFSVDPVGCQSCTGPGGATKGVAAFAPSSTLINNKNQGTAVATIPGDPLGTSSALNTANIAWHAKFSGNNTPYSNDQHPFLIWNMYRIDADGSIRQIGRSGVKHAFLTVNQDCMDSCNESNSLGLGCGDTYGTYNNDSPSDMGPRSEIVPAQGVWGRCGSIFDPDCNGSENDSGNDQWTQRMKVQEADLDIINRHPGATYRVESWYVARDDINIYNSMATIGATPHFAGSQWSLPGQSGYRLGPMIDRWVDPASPPAHALNTELAAAEGHAKVAVKATEVGKGFWRYDYVVQNLDFSRAVIEAPTTGPDPRVVSNQGFDSFSVPLPAGAIVKTMTSYIGEANPNVNWRVQHADSSASWSNDTSLPGLIGGNYDLPETLPTLDWGSMYSFSITVNAAPVTGNAILHVAQSGTPAEYSVAMLVPGG